MNELNSDIRDEPLESLYAGLTLPTRPGRAWLALGMVASLDGAAMIDGRSGGLSGTADQVAFQRLRGAADAILVGAGTVRIEGYGPALGSAERQADRASRGLQPSPRLVIVSSSLDLDGDHRVFSDPSVKPLVFTGAQADAGKRRAMEQRAEVVVGGPDRVDLTWMMDDLFKRGMRRILCEGGPILNAGLLTLDLVDELFLTISPKIVGGNAERIVNGPLEHHPQKFGLWSARRYEDELLLRYRKNADLHGNVDTPIGGGQ